MKNKKIIEELLKEMKQAMGYYRDYDIWEDLEIEVGNHSDIELHEEVLDLDFGNDYEAAQWQAGYIEGLRYAIGLLRGEL